MLGDDEQVSFQYSDGGIQGKAEFDRIMNAESFQKCDMETQYFMLSLAKCTFHK